MSATEKPVRVTLADPCKHCGKGDRQCSRYPGGVVSVCYRVGGPGSDERQDASGCTYHVYGLEDASNQVDASSEAGGPRAELASVEDRDAVYSAILGLLTLSASDERAMIARGFVGGQAARLGYRTLPAKGRDDMLGGAAAKFGVPSLLKVPGFFIDDRKKLKFSALPGILIPARNLEGRIVALTIKPERMLDNGGKYLWVSSNNKNGPSSGAPVNVPLGIAGPAETVMVTEGLLKSDLAWLLSGIPTLGNPGVGNWLNSIPILKSLGTKKVRIAYDSDWRENASVAKGLVKFAKGLRDEGFEVEIATWEGEPKGIDDLLAAGGSPTIHAGKDAARIIKEAGKVAHSKEGGVSEEAEAEAEGGNRMRVVKANDDPHRLARLFLGENFQHQGLSTLVHYRDEFHMWDGSAYRVYRDTQGDLVAGIEKEFNRINSEQIAKIVGNKTADQINLADLPIAKKVTTSIVNNTLLALKSESILSWDAEAPCWLDATEEERSSPLDILPAANGLLDLKSMNLIEPTPRFFSPFTLDYAYAPNSPPPVLWAKFLRQLWPDDSAAIRELQKWFGYFLTPDTRQQKIFLLIGPKRSGKGTIARVLERMIGEHNVASPTLGSLATNFGLWNLIGKAVAIIKDARLTGSSTDKAVVVERMLNISGEDAVDIDRKYQKPITQRLFSRLLILSNESPGFRDASGALAGRMSPLKLAQTFFGREDVDLTEKLYGEMPGILEWAIEGRRMLQEDRRFIIPESAKDLAEGMDEVTSPVKLFAAECCTVHTLDTRKSDELEMIRDFFSAYTEWSRLTRVEPGSENIFGRNLQAAYSHIVVERPRSEDASRLRRYRGIELNDNGRKLRDDAIERNLIRRPSYRASG